jgi:transposase
MARGEELTDEQQWAVIEPHLPELPHREDGYGPAWRESREVMNGILWILRGGACWQDLPGRFPPYQVCHRSSSSGSRTARSPWRKMGAASRCN